MMLRAVLLNCIFCCIALADTKPENTQDIAIQVNELDALSHVIRYVSSFGTWAKGARSGHCRLLVVDSIEKPYHSKAYLQWIADQPANNSSVSAGISPVKEINDAAVYRITGPRVIQWKRGERDSEEAMEFVAANQYTGESHTIRLQPEAIGHYTFQFIDKPYPRAIDSAVNTVPLRLDQYSRPTF